ncbi:MAG: hypothetical protein IPQ19_01670 [Bacteroidetes bacterium]|nr:hypothetical protein [Bacteroidota bacterium]
MSFSWCRVCEKIINNQEVENKHFCILNNYSLETSETVDTDEEGEIFDCLPGTYIIEADTFIKPTDTITLLLIA